MTMAAAIESRTADAAAQSKPGRIAGVEILHDLGEAEAVWRGLEAQRYGSTPYQHFDFLSRWQREVGERENLRPFIVIGHDAERRPLLLLPLALGRNHGVRVARFMGGRHTTFNMALWDRDFAAAATAADLAALLAAIRQRSGVDVLALTQQPRRRLALYGADPHRLPPSTLCDSTPMHDRMLSSCARPRACVVEELDLRHAVARAAWRFLRPRDSHL